MKQRSLAVALAMGLLFTAACGDDDEDAEASASASASDEAASGDDASEGEDATEGGEFCGAYAELLAGEPTPDGIREVAAIAPEEAVEPLEAIAAGAEAEGEAFFESTEFGEHFATLGAIANEECADTVIDVEAIDYGFEGIPEELEAGVVGINFENTGAELHELAILRKNDDTTETFDEILELSEEEGRALVTEAGGSFAFPGESATGLVDLSEPGDYIAVCFIPVGSTPDAGEEGGSGPPHFTQGMRVEFTVT